ncbi:MAG: Holliday junction resolvase RuvX [Caldicoprobacterales bacterium]|nr:Holliday junction resolvase RuvX [Clostridiales bacterium]
MRILSMDVGDKRIGMAVSDALGWTAQGIETLVRRSNQYDMEFIKNVLEQYQPQTIVIGLPRNMNGSLGPQGEKTKAFSESLQDFYSGEIVFWDERLTTVSAHKAMIEADISRKKRKQRVDQVAAVLILQSYLDYLNRK